MSIFVTTLLSVEADDLLSAVAANQINIECWIINPESCGQPVACPTVLVLLWQFFLSALHPFITMFLI